MFWKYKCVVFLITPLSIPVNIIHKTKMNNKYMSLARKTDTINIYIYIVIGFQWLSMLSSFRHSVFKSTLILKPMQYAPSSGKFIRWQWPVYSSLWNGDKLILNFNWEALWLLKLIHATLCGTRDGIWTDALIATEKEIKDKVGNFG